jgi:hypothetical protein
MITAVRIRLTHISLAGILFISAGLMQGCTVLAWLGIVCADVAHCSDVEFKSFEQAWVAPPEVRQQVPVRHIAVTPFAGDDLRMAEWWATVLGEATDHHVISPSEVAGRLPASVLTQMTQSTTDQDDIALARQISRDAQADAVLFGRVVSQPPRKAFLGLKERYPKRLYLHLVSAEGTPLWKAELPFAVVKGKKEVNEEMAKRSLLTLVRTQAKELGWTELERTARQKGS